MSELSQLELDAIRMEANGKRDDERMSLSAGEVRALLALADKQIVQEAEDTERLGPHPF